MIRSVFACVIIAAGSVAFAVEDFTEADVCHRGALAPQEPSAQVRQYAPDRKVDMLHLKLDVTPNFEKRTISGVATMTFKPIAKPLEDLRLDGIDFTVSKVESSRKLDSHHTTDEEIRIYFAEPIAVGEEATVSITYSATPSEGLYFRTPGMGYPNNQLHLFTQGEPIEARHWYPSYDAPNEKFTSEIICHVPPGMVVLSNGKKESEQGSTNGLSAVRWVQDKPHVNYLISLVAGRFEKIEDQYKDIPLAFYTPPSEIAEAKNSFQDTKNMMAFFEKEIGVSYPWSKYYQVVVSDFVAGGMENTSISTLTDLTLFRSETENLRSSQNLVAHELAHQWFGDLVTCKDWSHLWLNEGFATYYALLYEGHKDGEDAMRYSLFSDAKKIMALKDDTRPIVYRGYGHPREQFNVLAYEKGSWVLHMLRSQLGEKLFREVVQTYLDRHEYGNVSTEDLNNVLENVSGQSWDQFFDQWVYHAHYPEISADYSWDQKTKLAKVSVRQTQKVSADVLLFQFPLKIRFKSKAGDMDRVIQVKARTEDFYFPLESAPEIVRLDPDFELLGKMEFRVPTAMVRAQLADSEDVIGRIRAIEQLAERTDSESVQQLAHALEEDSFFGVRVEASKALRKIHTDEALAALIASRPKDARVRRQVASALGGFYSTNALARVQEIIAKEKNPGVLAEAIQALGPFYGTNSQALLRKKLDTTSYRASLASAAISAMRAQDDPVFIPLILEVLKSRGSEFTARGMASALESLAYLARNEADKGSVREFLVEQTGSQRQTIQLGALRALGVLEDPKAGAVLLTFAGAPRESAKSKAAETALNAIRSADTEANSLKGLREEILELKKDYRQTREELETLRKKMEATADATPRKASKPATKRK